MAAPLYFLPNVTNGDVAPGGTLNQTLIAARGLSHVFGECIGTSSDVALAGLSGQGPDKKADVIICALPTNRDCPRRVGFYPKEQTWHPAGDGSKFYIGLNHASPVTPEDVARPKRLRGHHVELSDGNQWEIPIIRSPNGDCNLPSVMFFDAADEFVQQVKKEYRDIWEKSAETSDLFYDPDTTRIDFDKALLYSLDALRLNYRIWKVEQRVLELIDSQNWDTVLRATVDWPLVQRYIDLEKKWKLTVSSRLAEFFAWRRGLRPDHSPSRGELYIAGFVDDNINNIEIYASR